MKPTFEVLTNCRFYLEVKLQNIPGSHDEIDGYFMECQGFQRSQEIIEIVEVTPQQWGKSQQAKFGRVVRTKIPGNSKSDNIILKRGLTISLAMWNWLKEVEEGNWSKQKKDGDLTIYDQGGEEQARFRFLGGWPVKYKLSGFKAGSNEFEIEEIELAVDEFIRVK